MQKQIEMLQEVLPQEYVDLIVDRINQEYDNDGKLEEAEDSVDVLCCAFNWYHSQNDEEYNFWVNVANHLDGHGELPDIPEHMVKENK